MVYEFDDLQLDLGRRQLMRDGEPVKLTRLSLKMLQVLVEAAPDLVSQDELIDKVWGANRVVSPETLSQRIKVLRQSLGDDAHNPRYVESVRGEGFRLIPPAVSPSTAAKTSPGGKSNWLSAAALLAVAGLLGALWVTFGGEEYDRQPDYSRGVRVNSVAVLPFANLSPEPDNSFYASGLHEEVLNQLAKLSDLRVISRTSMLRYAGTLKPIPDIAKELEVDTLVEGSVRYADNRIRVTIQLVDGASDEHLWSETYDRKFENIFEIESDIARNVAVALRRAMPAKGIADRIQPPTTSLDAYAHYMQGRQAMLLRNSDQLRKGISHFEQAVELDPDYVAAWVGLADSLALVGGVTGQQGEETFAARQAAIDRALALDPGSGGAWLSLAKLREAQWLLDEAEEYYLRSIDLGPENAHAYHWYGKFLVIYRQRPEDALPQLRKSVSLDPMEPSAIRDLILALWTSGRVEETLALTRKRITLEPEYAFSHGYLSLYLDQLGRLDEALYWARDGAQIDPGFLSIRWRECRALLALGDLAAAEDCHATVVADFPDNPAAQYWAELSMYRRQPEQFLEQMLALDALVPPIASHTPLTLAYLENGMVAEARTVFSKHWPQHFGSEEVSITSAHEIPWAVTAGLILLLDGDTERADELFDAVLEMRPYTHRTRGWNYGVMDVYIHAARGDRPKAIAALREAIDAGWRNDWWRLRGPLFLELGKESEWRALMAQLQQDIARQRAVYEAHKDDSGYWQ